MSIILGILKWLLILLVILVGLVLVLTALVLFVPVRYFIEGKNENKLIYSYRLTWLFRLLMIRKKADSDEIWLYVLFIPVKLLNGNDTKSKKTKRSKQEPITETAECECDVIPVEFQKMEVKEEPEEENVKEKKVKQRKKRKRKKTFSFDTVSSIIDFVKDKRNRNALGVVWNEFCQLLKHISPKKVKGDFVIGTGDPSTTGMLFGGISLCPFVYVDGVNMIPDFDEAVFKAQGYAKGRVSILYLVRLFIRIYQDRELRRLWRNIKRINKKEAA